MNDQLIIAACCIGLAVLAVIIYVLTGAGALMHSKARKLEAEAQALENALPKKD